jgi:hypothetical protein
MIEHFALDLCIAVGSLMDHLAKLESRITSVSALDAPFFGMAEDLTTAEKDHIALVVGDPIAREGDRLELGVSARRAKRLAKDLREGMRYSSELLAAELKGILESVVHEISSRKFAYIPPDRVAYFEQDHLFGEVVSKSFPSAAKEIRDAGNCLASELDTSAVFHLMRAVEIGLRALATERHVKIKNTESFEWVEWGKLTSELGKKADTIENWKGRGTAKSLALDFYRGVNRELEGFRTEFRNHVMHTRKRFEPNQAFGVFLQVREFMQRLTRAGLVESQKKSIVWRKRTKELM